MTVLACAMLFSQATVSHTFVYESSQNVTSVNVAGTFNNWNKDADPMVRESGARWTLKKTLPAGVYQYKFVLNGSDWIVDPKAEKNVDDGEGHVNSVITLLTPSMRVPASRTDSNIAGEMLAHKMESPFVRWDRGSLRLRLQARKGDLSRAELIIKGLQIPMARVDSDDYYDWFQANVSWKQGATAHYGFQVQSGQRTERFGPNGLESSDDFFLSSNLTTPQDVPEWPRSTIFYQIFPDRFANGNKANDPVGVMSWNGKPTYANYFGGDLAGVKSKIPYLKSLGIGAIYFNPMFKSPVNHGYETTDYHEIEPKFGSNAEFADLTRDLRRNGIRTVLDGVFNHTATDFAPFADIVRNGEKSRYTGWYKIYSYPVKVGNPPNYEAWFGFPSLPKVNYSSSEAFKYMLGVPIFWDKHADIAGWRLDAANEVVTPFWQQFRKTVKGLGRDRWIVGEVWGDGRQWLRGDQWDSIMGYQFRDAVLKFVASGSIPPSAYFKQLMRVNDSYSPEVSRNLMILLGSHDTPRILTLCQGRKDLAMMAATLQLTWVGTPSIYYGDEIGMEGGRDPENRRGMDWAAVNSSNPMLKHYRALVAARRSSRALQVGDPKLLLADDDRGVLAYARVLGAEEAIVAVNRAKKDAILDLRVKGNGPMRNIFDNQVLRSTSGVIRVRLKANASAVLIPAASRRKG